MDLNEHQLRTIFETLEAGGQKAVLDQLSRSTPALTQEQLFEGMIRQIETARRDGDDVRAERFCKAGINLTQHDGLAKAPYFIVFMAALCDLLSRENRDDELEDTLAAHSMKVKDICHLYNEEIADPGSRMH